MRGEKVGVFGKVRPGLMRFGKVFKTVRECTRIDPTPLPEDCFVPENRFAIDVGGVLEYYPTSQSVVRFDVGDTIIHTRRKSIIFSPVFAQDIPSRTDHNSQFNIGVGFRF